MTVRYTIWESLDSLEKNAKKPPLVVGIRGKMDLNKIENNPKNEKNKRRCIKTK